MLAWKILYHCGSVASPAPKVLKWWKYRKNLVTKFGYKIFDIFNNINEITLSWYWVYEWIWL